jgi:hypothetical protein
MVFIVPDSQCSRNSGTPKCTNANAWETYAPALTKVLVVQTAEAPGPVDQILEEALPTLAARRGVRLGSIVSHNVGSPTASAEPELLSPIDFAMSQAKVALKAYEASVAAEPLLPTKVLNAFDGPANVTVCEAAAEPEPLSPIDFAVSQAKAALKAYDGSSSATVKVFGVTGASRLECSATTLLGRVGPSSSKSSATKRATKSSEPDCFGAAVRHCLPAWFGGRSEGPYPNC